MTEDEIRDHILFTLTRLYEDPMHRTQFKRFTFGSSERKPARKILAKLSRNFVIEQLQPDVVRLTDYGYRQIRSDYGKSHPNLPVNARNFSRGGPEMYPVVK